VDVSSTIFKIFTLKARKILVLPTPPWFVTPFEFCDEIWHQKTRIMGLPDGEEITMLAFFVLIQYWRVTDGWTDRQVQTLLLQRPTLA